MLPRTVMFVIGLAILALLALGQSSYAANVSIAEHSLNSSALNDIQERVSAPIPPCRVSISACAVECASCSLVLPGDGLLTPVQLDRKVWLAVEPCGTCGSSLAPAIPPPRA